MSKVCEMHIVADCRLCAPKVAAPATPVLPQVSAGADNTGVAMADTLCKPAESFQDTKAVAMLAAAQEFARATEDLSTIDARITHLESELVTARTHRLEFLAAQVSANDGMRALLDSLAARVKPHNDAAVAIANKPFDEETLPF